MVLAVGAWAPTVAGAVAPLPPLRVIREQWLVLSPVNAVVDRWPAFIHRTVPVRYGLVTPGEGVKVGEHGTGVVVDPDRRSFDPDPAAAGRVLDYARRWLPGLIAEPVQATTCLYTVSPAEDFLLDRHGPFVVAAGFSGHGFKFAPAVGRILADLTQGAPQSEARFALACGRRAAGVSARSSL